MRRGVKFLTHQLRGKQHMDFGSVAALSLRRARRPVGTSRSALWWRRKKNLALQTSVPEPPLCVSCLCSKHWFLPNVFFAGHVEEHTTP